MSDDLRQPDDIATVRQRSRLAGPTSPPSLVGMPRLDARYADATGRVVRVVAPGGYGKSTTVARWVASENRPTRWLDVEPIDNDPLVLGATLELALFGLTDGSPRISDLDWTDVTAASVLAETLERTPPFVLVIDDIHHIEDTDSLRLVDLLADRLPPDSTLVLAGRAHHTQAIARLRLQPGVIDVTAQDLAFDLGETEQMMLALGIQPDIDDVTNLFAQFEGWPAGLRLASLAFDRRDRRPAGDAFDGLERSHFVTDYVSTEWLGALDADDRVFLRGAACLGRFTADMCDEVLGRSGSAATLARLAHEAAMVMPLDQRDDWFRMHPLLSSSLSSELRSEHKQRWLEIHVGAAQWWAAQGDADLAIDHALTAGDAELAEKLIVGHAPRYMTRGMGATVLRWLDGLGDRVLSSPVLCSYAAVVALQTGRGDRAAQLMALVPDNAAGASYETKTQMDIARTVVAPCAPTESIGLSEHLSDLPAGAWRATARWVRAVNLFFVGDPRARDELHAAMSESELAELAVMHTNVLATMSLIDDIEGRRTRAEELARRARDQVGRQRSETLATTAVVASATAVAAARGGAHTVARESLALARKHYLSLQPVSPWLNIIGRLGLVRACLLLGDPAQAQELLGELRDLREGDGRIAVDELLDELTDEVALATALLGRHSQPLTDAELRVLQFLPTNLSLSEIAARLFVSRHTVKSHSGSIYRKLGVNSRTDAVERARESGLLSGV